MSLPDFQTLMLPVLKYAASADEHTLVEAVNYLKEQFKVTPDEERQLIPSGRQPIFYNRVGWARTYLKQAGLLEQTRRGVLKITPKGQNVLDEKIARIDMKYLERFPEYISFRDRTRNETKEIPKDDIVFTPEETLEKIYENMKDELSQELLELIKKGSPAFFEKLVVDLLLKMGYGGSGSGAGRVIGKVGDEGLDGVIDEDKLGLESIYIQAKKWSDATIGRPDVQKFVGALHGKRAHKGIFITASKFTDQAIDYVSSIETKVVLIDGQKLTELMIENEIGVSISSIYKVKKVDSDFFETA